MRELSTIKFIPTSRSINPKIQDAGVTPNATQKQAASLLFDNDRTSHQFAS
jgi:hypothetical protein